MIIMEIGSLRKLAYQLREDGEELTLSPDEILGIVKYCVDKEQEIEKCYTEIADKEEIIVQQQETIMNYRQEVAMLAAHY